MSLGKQAQTLFSLQGKSPEFPGMCDPGAVGCLVGFVRVHLFIHLVFGIQILGVVFRTQSVS